MHYFKNTFKISLSLIIRGSLEFHTSLFQHIPLSDLLWNHDGN